VAEPNKDGDSTCCKVRGITLNHKNVLDINFETVKEMVTGKKESVTVLDEYKICRNTSKYCIITKAETKEYKIVFDKRVITDNYVTLPYGM